MCVSDPDQAEYKVDELAEIGKLIDAKKLKVVVSETFPLADAAKALAKGGARHARGEDRVEGSG